MLPFGGGLFSIAALFYFAAEYEHLSGWKWALASVAVSATVKGLFPGSFIFILPAQFGLFLVMWWAHVKNQGQRQVDLAKPGADPPRERQERASRARQGAAPPTAFGAQARERETALPTAHTRR